MGRIISIEDHTIEISPGTWERCIAYGRDVNDRQRRQGYKRESMDGPRKGEPDPVKSSIEGNWAEAGARIRMGLSLEPMFRPRPYGDNGIDGLLLCYYFQTKWAGHSTGRLIFQPREKSHLEGLKWSDAWILVVPVSKKQRILRVAGWTWSVRMPELWRWERKRYNDPCYEIQQNKLYDFEQFMRICKTSGSSEEVRDRGHGFGWDFVKKARLDELLRRDKGNGSFQKRRG